MTISYLKTKTVLSREATNLKLASTVALTSEKKTSEMGSVLFTFFLMMCSVNFSD